MKEILALLVGLSIFGGALFCAWKRYISLGLTVILFVFSLFAGLAVANHDLLQRIQWRIPGFSFVKEQVFLARDEAVDDVCREGELQVSQIRGLLDELSQRREQIEAGLKGGEALLASAGRLEELLRSQDQLLKEQTDKTEKISQQTIRTYQSLTQLALILTRISWLQLQAISEKDSNRREMAVKEATDGLDTLVELVIEDPQVRSDFVAGVMDSLPGPVSR